MDDAAERRHARAAEVETALAGLRRRHDIAMSAFRFEEAATLGRAIAALESEHQALAATLPAAEPETGAVPMLVRLRRTRRRSRG